MSEFEKQHELQQFTNLELLARQVVEGFITGLHKSPFHGFSVEFAEHRLYNPGESVRNIDWKLFARTDKLFVKRFEEETNLRCQIIMDHSSSMYFPEGENNKINFSVKAAASLIYLLRKQRDAFGLSVFSDHIEFSSDAKSTTVHQKLLFSMLNNLLIHPTKKVNTSIAHALHYVAENTHKRSLVVIFSDMFDLQEEEVLFSGLQHLRHNKHEVVLFHVTDQKKEMEFEFENRPYIFVDVETSDEVKLYPEQVKEMYLREVNKFHKNLKDKCAQYRIDFIEADVQSGFDKILSAYLVKRSRMI